MTTFDNCWTALVGNEGGYSNNPEDAGGETMWGITARVARAHGYTGDMKDLPQETAKRIAKEDYWDPYHCDDLPAIIAFQVLDTAYNGGHTVMWLQQAVGVLADGVMGPITVKAVQVANPYIVVMRFLAYRLKYMKDARKWPYFSRGWADRIANNLLRAAK